MDYRAAVDLLTRYAQYAQKRASEPGLLTKFARGLTDLPREVYQTGRMDVGPEEALPYSLNALSAAALRPNPTGLGIFGGVGAKTANKTALSVAEMMEKAGSPADQIWEVTGWGRGKDGKWRFEIDDSGSRLDSKFGQPGDYFGTVGKYFEHPELYEAYPHFQRIELGPASGGYRGTYRGGDYPSIDVAAGSGVPEGQARSTMLHELQHAVQEAEGFARGSNVNRHAGEAKKFAERSRRSVLTEKMIDNRLLYGRVSNEERSRLLAAKRLLTDFRSATNPKADPYYHYRRTAGETEARTVQHRADWDKQKRRDVPPEFSDDVPRSRQTVRFE